MKALPSKDCLSTVYISQKTSFLKKDDLFKSITLYPVFADDFIKNIFSYWNIQDIQEHIPRVNM